MRHKRKLFGLGLLACSAAVAFVAVTASANQEGHFVTAGTNVANVVGTENLNHTLEWTIDGLGGGIICNSGKWDLQTSKETENELVIEPVLQQCRTTGDPPSFNFKVNGCKFWLFAAKGTTDATEQTAKLECSVKPMEIPHPVCTITVPGQANLTGITYTKITFNGKSAITMDFKVKLAMEAHGAFCGAAKKTGVLEGSLRIKAFNLSNQPVDITVT
jgi:hypothetical protein